MHDEELQGEYGLMEVNLHTFLTPTLISYTLDSGLDCLQGLKVVAKTKHAVLATGVEALAAICRITIRWMKGRLPTTYSVPGQPLWSSGQSSCLQIHRSPVRFPSLPDFLRSSGSGTRSTQPCEDN
jgi:hypothetical protein